MVSMRCGVLLGYDVASMLDVSHGEITQPALSLSGFANLVIFYPNLICSASVFS
jgi:hypothetical protein